MVVISYYMRRFIYVLIMVLGVFATSCERNNEAKIRELVRLWQGKHVVLPGHVTDAVSGDTVDLSASEFTILTYIDSLGCTGCKMKLPLWNEFLSSIDSITESDVTALMVIHTTDLHGVVYLLRSNGYEYPAYIDTNDMINRNNSFPSESMFQSFLLDSDHRVIAVGNPVYNNSVANLYKDIISGGKVVTSSGSVGVVVNDRTHDIGDIRIGETVKHRFILSNVSCDTVYIRKLLSSCDCTIAETDKRLIAPGGKSIITVTSKEDSIIGRFTRSIHIFYEGFINATQLEISGNVIR